MSSGHLLDANALIALLWPRHEHHDRLRRWFSRHAAQGWATCAFTQSAFVRIVCQPAFAGQALAVSEVSELLMRNAAHPGHRLLAMDFGIAEVLGCCTGGVVGHRQVTDAWLLTLAVRHAMKLLTLDRGVSSLLATDAERARHVTLL
jgi:toxin-antitoxin system PIN domain toxin